MGILARTLTSPRGTNLRNLSESRKNPVLATFLNCHRRRRARFGFLEAPSWYE